MAYKFPVYVFLLSFLMKQAYSGLLENMTTTLTLANQERLERSQEHIKALGVLGMNFGKDLNSHGEGLRTELNGIRQDLRNLLQEVKGHREELKQHREALSTRDENLRKEGITQHEEMMRTFNQISKSLDSTHKEELVPELRDCASLYKYGKRINGVYRIKPDVLADGFDVFCDLENDGGGWTVFQRRGNFSTSRDFFYKTWDEYKTGFGNLEEEHWLGNNRISSLSRQRAYELHIEMMDYEYNRNYAVYKKFAVEGEDQLYKLHVGLFSGSTRDPMARHNGMSFTTYDMDNDLHRSQNCAEKYAGAWWYKDCYDSNLNAKKDRNQKYLCYVSSTGAYVDLFYVVMKIRPLSF